MKTILVLICILLAGCSGMRVNPYNNLTPLDKSIQIMHVADVLQTNSIVNSDCYYERDTITKRVIGKHPSHLKVAMWGAGKSYLYAQAAHVINDSDIPTWGKNTIKAFMLYAVTEDVYDNHSIGLRFTTGNKITDC